MASIWDTSYHVVFTTKYRKEVFLSTLYRSDMKSLLREVAKVWKFEILSLEVCKDHVHLLVSIPPQLSVSSVVQKLKGRTSYYWFIQHPETKRTLWGGNLWSNAYYVCTVGDISKDIVAKYIASQ